ncbi:MAG: VapC toxin family PIN domain ribonuclease [Actinobacteria bacterium]|nr:VapC toxin family PIN domain ribonuclease [Micrococcales bacterium]MCB0904201.1 VapC toxin family PIN domain ribonuclease [Actinomycetota bacterium]MCB9428672.1 VapC toxin family PIN domain ribonuclease [Actinomycetota bacterium]
MHRGRVQGGDSGRTSIWIDHLRATRPVLVELLVQAQVATHEFVIAELALGSISGRTEFLAHLRDLPMIGTITHDEIMSFIEGQALFGRGIGLVDAHLLGAARLVPGTSVWTKDRRLAAAAQDLGVCAQWP